MGYFDLPPEASRHFPSHGWIKGSNGARNLRLPILRLFQLGEPTFDRFIENKIAGVWLQFNAPYRTLRQLGIGLRDLHREIRELHSNFRDHWTEGPTAEGDSAHSREREGYERVEILLIAVLVLLRRLADELMAASGPFLFRHWKSAPKKLMDAVSKAKDGTLARQTEPICDFDILVDALQNHTDWVTQLRKSDGIRDIVIHWPHYLQVSREGTQAPGDAATTWRVTAQLASWKSGDIRTIDVLPTLVDCIAGACRFMDRLYCCATPLDDYRRGDLLFITGADNDVVGFWPPIQGVSGNFPLAS